MSNRLSTIRSVIVVSFPLCLFFPSLSPSLSACCLAVCSYWWYSHRYFQQWWWWWCVLITSIIIWVTLTSNAFVLCRQKKKRERKATERERGRGDSGSKKTDVDISAVQNIRRNVSKCDNERRFHYYRHRRRRTRALVVVGLRRFQAKHWSYAHNREGERQTERGENEEKRKKKIRVRRRRRRWRRRKKNRRKQRRVGRRKDASSAAGLLACLLAEDQVLCRSEHEIYIFCCICSGVSTRLADERKRPCARAEEFRWESDSTRREVRSKFASVFLLALLLFETGARAHNPILVKKFR